MLVNLPVTSREYKLILNVDRFTQLDKGREAFWDILEFLVVHKFDGEIIKKQDKSEKRRTWYLDTPSYGLRKRGYVLRVRQEEDEDNEYKVTLKYRASDRYVSASRDLSTTLNDAKSKFEEDILPPFTSKFSHSTSAKVNKLPDLSDVGAVSKLFPKVEVPELEKNIPIVKVNDFTANEVVYKLGQFRFSPNSKIKAAMSFWYLLGTEKEWPLIGEFSFDYDLNKDDHSSGDLEMFPVADVNGCNQLFGSLQKQDYWINLKGTTKTAYAYEGF